MKIRFAHLVRYLVLVTLALGLALPLTLADSLTEDSTGVSYTLTRANTSSETTLDLSGVGVRKKYGIAKVYAFALYVDAKAIAPALAAWHGKNADQLRDDDAFYDALIAAPAEKLVVMTFVRTVSGEKMMDALDDALGRGVAENDPVRRTFLDMWTEEIKNKEEVAIGFGPAGEVTVYRSGKVTGQVSSKDLATALLRSWLGTETVSDDIREGAAERFPSLI